MRLASCHVWCALHTEESLLFAVEDYPSSHRQYLDLHKKGNRIILSQELWNYFMGEIMSPTFLEAAKLLFNHFEPHYNQPLSFLH